MTGTSLAYMFQEDLYTFATPLLVVLKNPWESYSADEHKLLEKILTSVKVDINSVHMATMASVEFRALEVFAPSRVLIFGSETGQDIPLYQETAAHSLRVIRADDLGNLNEERKKHLWSALRQMFGL
jgi:hypothetical protein